MTALRVLLLALAVVGCYSTAGPSPAGGIEDVIANLVLRGVTVEKTVSGDAGCGDPTLHDNAVHLTVSYQGESSELYVFQWRRVSDFDAAAANFAGCVDQFRGSHPGLAVETLDAPPWRAYGPAQPEPILAFLSDALREAGGS